MSKILVAIPCMDQCPTPFMQSVATMLTPPEDRSVVATQMGSLIYTSRNNLALRAMAFGKDEDGDEAIIGTDFDYVLWLDSDMVFSQDLLIRMKKVMDDNNLDFLTGLYYRRQPPYSPVLFDTLEINGTGGCTWTDFEEVPTEGLFKVGGCGFGAVLIKTDVLFDVQAKYGNMFQPIANMGEDLSFCWRARQCGYDIWCDPSIELGHIGYVAIGRKFYESYKGVHKEAQNDQSAG